MKTIPVSMKLFSSIPILLISLVLSACETAPQLTSSSSVQATAPLLSLSEPTNGQAVTNFVRVSGTYGDRTAISNLTVYCALSNLTVVKTIPVTFSGKSGVFSVTADIGTNAVERIWAAVWNTRGAGVETPHIRVTPSAAWGGANSASSSADASSVAASSSAVSSTVSSVSSAFSEALSSAAPSSAAISSAENSSAFSSSAASSQAASSVALSSADPASSAALSSAVSSATPSSSAASSAAVSSSPLSSAVTSSVTPASSAAASSALASSQSPQSSTALSSAVASSQGASSSAPFVGLSVHFKNTGGWGNVYVYGWTNAGATAVTLAGAWPGKTIQSNANGWYSYTFTNVAACNLIFNNNSDSMKTPDLARTNLEGWYSNGSWLNSNPDDKVLPAVAFVTPSEGALLTGTVSLFATAEDNVSIAKVEFYCDTVLAGTVSNAPYSFNWNSAWSTAGAHTLFAVAFDPAGNTATNSRSVITSNGNVPPVANAGADMTALIGQPAVFNASASYDPNGSIVSYSWNNGMNGVKPTNTYNAVGVYNVTLTVTDNDGATNADTVKVTVVSNMPHRDWREETVYFLMTDRFADGNANNNNIWGDEYLLSESDKYNIGDWSKSGPLSRYHGGDFQGIIDNLDYISNMGFTAIWITPVVKQPEGRHKYDPNDSITGNGGDYYEASGFHGYWGYDFDQIDPHLHNSGKDSDGWSDFDNLISEVHKRGMKLMLDIVVNHGHPGAVAQTAKYFDKRSTVIMDGQSWTWQTGDPYWNAAQTPHTDGFFSYYGGIGLIDLIDFNENGDPAKNAIPHLKNVYKRFIDHGVDAFRIDTAAYMKSATWQDFTTTMKDYAKSKGNDYFYMCGEAWTGDRTSAVSIIYNNGQNSNFNMLDLHGSSMDFPGWMGRAFRGDGGFDDPNGWKRISGVDGDASGKYDPTYLSTFIDNHDVTRANGILSMAQYMNDLNYIYLWRGIPIVFYGTEILYSSWPNYITTTVKDDVIARWYLGSSGIDYAKNNQPTLYKHIKMLNSLRHSSVALQKGTQTDIEMVADKGVFKRVAGDSVAFVALSKGAGYSTTFTGMPNGTYRKITPNSAAGSYNSANVEVTDGTCSVTVDGNSFVMLDK